MNRHFSLCLLALMLALAGCGGGNASRDAVLIHASGFIEGREYALGSSLGGRVSEVRVQGGDLVRSNQVLIHLDTKAVERAHEAALVGLSAAESALEELVDRPTEEELTAAMVTLSIAEAKVDAAEAELDLLIESYRPAQPPTAARNASQSAVEIARADVVLKQAQLEQVEAGADHEEIKIGQSIVEEARANVRLIECQLDELTLTTPVTGVVSQLLVKVGEFAMPGTTLATVIDPGHLTLTVYIPETQVASVEIGDRAEVTTDSYPDVIFMGEVRGIANQAQFTPSDVQTKEERVKLVFAVEILLQDPEGLLKPGMPADAVIQP
jgi:HlyD family secretion protein